MTPSLLARLVILVLISLSANGCGSFIYGVDILNFGHRGVLLLQVGDIKAENIHKAYRDVGVPFPIIGGRFPSIPSKYRDTASSFGSFQGYEREIPDEIDIAWQLADLENCKDNLHVDPANLKQVEEIRRLGYTASQHVSKQLCQWTPLPDKIYRKKLDLRQIKNTDAYKRTGDRYKEVAGSRYTLNITLIFIEDQVKVEVDNGATNPWL